MKNRIRLIVDRFEEKFVEDPDSGCWVWQAGKNAAGYGQITTGKAPVLAHRLSWMLIKGFIPEGVHVLHHCDNPPCVNPDHLFLGTDKDNVWDMKRKGRASSRRAFGQRTGQAKLTDEQAKAIYADPRTQAEICKDYGVCEATVAHIKSGRNWSKVTGAKKKVTKHVDDHHHHPATPAATPSASIGNR